MRPLRKSRTLKVRVSEGEYSRLVALAAGRPVGPAMVAAALGVVPAAAAQSALGAPTVREALRVLEAWVDGLDRLSTSKGPLLRLVPQLAALVRDA